MRPKILLLGGTRDARDVAACLIGKAFDVTTSLAGVTEQPMTVPGAIRRGGFGGKEGLLHYLRDARVNVIADVTHPFAAQISRHAHAASLEAGIPYLRLERPAWHAVDGDLWTSVPSLAAAAAALPDNAWVLLTTGRKELEPFISRDCLSGVIRTIESPPILLPARWTLVRERPPFTLQEELALMQEHGITHLVTKNAGGAQTEAKLAAARHLRLPVIMIQRPLKPEAEIYATAEEICTALVRRFGP
jgi:precorrin-6A/cobalt-precorrin-6A reductase